MLALVNTAAMNMDLQVFLKYDVKSLGVSVGVLKLGHRLVLFLAFRETSNLISKVAALL